MKTQIKTAVFSESCVPPLESGQYLMTVSQQSETLGNSEPARQTLLVEGPRFTVAREEILSLYPPDNMRGNFSSSLPHIVFKKKTLPWERSVRARTDGLYAEPSFKTPWLALLQLWESEIIEIIQDKAENAVKPAASTYFPRLNLREGEKNNMIEYIDIETALFRKVFPAYEDLVYLCHGRQTDPYLKSDSRDTEGEWCSAVMGARLLDVSDSGSKNRVYVVSLEGFGNYSDNTEIDKYSYVRLIVLSSWTYECVTDPYNFKEICIQLNHSVLTPPAIGGEEIKPYLENGFIPFAHHLRNGDRTVSFYRGPLIPAPEETKNIPSAPSADSLYIYDPDTGMFDLSYACAWQTGRLITLNQQSVATKILKARKLNHQKTHKNSLTQMMNQHHDLEVGVRLTDKTLETLSHAIAAPESQPIPNGDSQIIRGSK